jgi:D-alanyl-D-alanine carboxypeptidase
MRIYLFILWLLLPLYAFAQVDSLHILAINKLSAESENPVHAILLYAEQKDKVLLNSGYGKLHESGAKLSGSESFRIASITKLFVATLIMQLAEEQKLSLEDKALYYLKELKYVRAGEIHVLNGQNYSAEILVKQLLSHRSGLADIFSDRSEEFFGLLKENPRKSFDQEKILKLYYDFELNKTPHFAPGKGWSYSDMNYVLLGLIIEQIEEKSLASVMRERFFDPLKMNNTYFEYYEVSPLTKDKVHPYFGTLDMTTVNTSFDWAGGGIVSNNAELAIFIKALFQHKLIRKTSLDRMTRVESTKENENRYGLGIYESVYNGNTFFGHYGFYGTYIGYCPELEMVLSYCISQATPDFNVYAFINEILKFFTASY